MTGHEAVCFLWHCPAGHPGSALPTTLPCGARTFLDMAARATPRPPGRLVRRLTRIFHRILMRESADSHPAASGHYHRRGDPVGGAPRGNAVYGCRSGVTPRRAGCPPGQHSCAVHRGGGASRTGVSGGRTLAAAPGAQEASGTLPSTSFRPAVTCGSRHDRSAQPEQEIWDQACRRWADVHCLARKGDRVSRPERRGQDDNHPAAARPGQARHGRGQDRRQALPRSGRTSATSSPSSTCHRPTPTTAGCSRSCVTSDPDGPGRAGRWPRVRRSGARCR